MLRRLRVEQVRCFQNLDLRLNEPQDGGDGWTVLVGANGLGKSTILQSLVIGSMDPRPVTSLVPAPWTMCRANLPSDARPSIRVDGLFSGRRRSSTRLLYPQAGRYVEDEGDLLGIPLLLAFSARRRIAHPGELPASDNAQLERVRGLFETDHPLLTGDPFAALPDKASRRRFAKVVRDVITFRTEDEAMFPLVDDVELRGKGGVTRNAQLLEQRRFQLRYGPGYSVRVGVEDLSDGYQAMLALVLEILSQAALEDGNVPDPDQLEAVVLIDELEAHLHPRWQRTVMPLLRSAFPRCQFVVSTHSPLVVGSARAGEVHVLEVDEAGAVRSTELDQRLSMLGADEIIEEVFGVPRPAPPSLVKSERKLLFQLATERRKLTIEDQQTVEDAWEDALRASEPA